MAARAAMASPLLESGAIDGARGILINITGSTSLKLSEVNAASTIIQSAAHEDANIIFGAVLDESMKDEVKITVIATGFRNEQPQRREKMLGLADESLDFIAEPIPVGTIASTPPPFASQAHTAQSEPMWPTRSMMAQEPMAEEPEYADEVSAEPIAEYEPPAMVAEPVEARAPEKQQENIDIPAFLRRGGL
jgi:cell division protein FtsZ